MPPRVRNITMLRPRILRFSRLRPTSAPNAATYHSLKMKGVLRSAIARAAVAEARMSVFEGRVIGAVFLLNEPVPIYITVVRTEVCSTHVGRDGGSMIWYERGGVGNRTALLLHGLGATAAVWKGVARVLQQRATVCWLAPDLSGHGGSGWQPFYSVGQMAAEVAEVVGESGELFVVGHSLGAYLGLALASGWFGIEVRGVLGIGPKIAWPTADLEAARETRRTSGALVRNGRRGLGPLSTRLRSGGGIAPGDESLARGARYTPSRVGGLRRTRAVSRSPARLSPRSRRALTARVLLARGEHDPMVSLEELRMHDAQACDISGAGHNAHIEDPRAVVALHRAPPGRSLSGPWMIDEARASA